MKLFFSSLLALHALSIYAADNLPDWKDENIVPAEQEERVYEDINRSDVLDRNLVPAEEEERQEREYPDSNSDIIDRDAFDDEVRD